MYPPPYWYTNPRFLRGMVPLCDKPCYLGPTLQIFNLRHFFFSFKFELWQNWWFCVSFYEIYIHRFPKTLIDVLALFLVIVNYKNIRTRVSSTLYSACFRDREPGETPFLPSISTLWFSYSFRRIIHKSQCRFFKNSKIKTQGPFYKNSTLAFNKDSDLDRTVILFNLIR